MMIKVCIIQNSILIFYLNKLGTFLYNFPSSDLRSKSNRFISNKNHVDNSASSSIDTTQLLTNLFKGMKHQHN